MLHSWKPARITGNRHSKFLWEAFGLFIKANLLRTTSGQIDNWIFFGNPSSCKYGVIVCIQLIICNLRVVRLEKWVETQTAFDLATPFSIKTSILLQNLAPPKVPTQMSLRSLNRALLLSTYIFIHIIISTSTSLASLLTKVLAQAFKLNYHQCPPSVPHSLPCLIGQSGGNTPRAAEVLSSSEDDKTDCPHQLPI